MKSLLSSAFVALAILASQPPLQAQSDASEFADIHSAFTYWLGQDPLLDTSTKEDSRFANFRHLNAVALHKLLYDNSNDWHVHYTADYDIYGFELAPTLLDMQVDKHGNEEEILTSGYYFLYRGTDPTSSPRLIARPSNRYEYFEGDNRYFLVQTVKVFYPDGSLAVADELMADLGQYLDEKNIYKNAIVEFEADVDFSLAANQLRFMRNLDRSELPWESLILDAETKEYAFQNSEAFFDRIPRLRAAGVSTKKGLLLEGPPGTGKSYMGKVLVSSVLQGDLDTKATLFIVTARHLQFKHSIKSLFEEARRLAPSIIFIEDIDLLGIKTRDGSSEDTSSKDDILNEFLNAIDGVVDNEGLLTIGTTNKVDKVDRALLRSLRLGIHLTFDLPRFPERKVFFERFGLRRAVWAPGIEVDWLASESEGMSGAAIIEVIKVAKQTAFEQDSWSGDDLLLTLEHFTFAFETVRAGGNKNKGTTSLAMQLEDLDQWEQRTAKSRSVTAY